MGVRLSSQEGVVCMFDSTIGQAFGPIFEGDDAEEKADLFLRWYNQTFHVDVRVDWFSGNPGLLMTRFSRWMEATTDEMTGEWNRSIAESMVR